MAFIDYGAVVFKNGRQMNFELFDDMLKAVGWVDRKRKLYEDCDHMDEWGVSECWSCPRARMEDKTFCDGSVCKVVAGDCRDEALRQSGSMDGNSFAFIGDEGLTLAFYKTGVRVAVNKEPADHFWECGYRHWGDPPRKSYWEEYNGVPLHIKEVCRNVYHLSMVYKSDSYHVVYGSGIDPDKDVWNRVKVDYLGKRGAKAVDKLYKRFGGLVGKN